MYRVEPELYLVDEVDEGVLTWRGAVFVGGGEFGEGGQGVGEVGRRGWRVGRRAQLYF